MEYITDIAIIGGGHGAVEAALAGRRMGHDTCIITMDIEDLGSLSCNPSIGGPGKAQLVCEIDALGGSMGILSDEASVQSRMLNTSKGPAVQSPRVQLDRKEYKKLTKDILEYNRIVKIFDEATDLHRDGENWIIQSFQGHLIKSKAIIIATGTFLGGTIYVGDKIGLGGRIGAKASNALCDALKRMSFSLFRLKTGTPPRILAESVNRDIMERQDEEDFPPRFSKKSRAFRLERMPCFITRTSEETHKIVLENLKKSAAFSGIIEGSGPRYCPSFENKVETFPNRKIHRVFVEPEGLSSKENYLQGLSTSMPEDIQEKMLKSVPGLEDVIITRYGYAVEYECIDARVLDHSLQSRQYPGLFFAGQINGTSGYEEAAAQGLIAGANAGLYIQKRKPLVLARHEAYIGVLIDDLIKKGCDEPYRMFTSSCEYRILLRCQNANIRLAEKAWEIGLIKEDEYEENIHISKQADLIEREMRKNKVKENSKYMGKYGNFGDTYFSILGKPGNNWEIFDQVHGSWVNQRAEVLEEVYLRARYDGYIPKLLREAGAIDKASEKLIPSWVDYARIKGLSREAKERWRQFKPVDIATASLIPGVNPADIGLLLFHIKRGKKGQDNE